jgi:predicted dehydrogenase
METYAGKLLKAEDYADVPVKTEDCATALFRLDNGAPGSLVVSQVSAGRKNRLYFEADFSKRAIEWDQEDPNRLWVGRREAANEEVIKDASLMHPEARPFTHYPGGHPEGYSEGPLNLFANVYAAIAGAPHASFPTFADGHDVILVCEAVLESHRKRAWVEVAR